MTAFGASLHGVKTGRVQKVAVTPKAANWLQSADNMRPDVLHIPAAAVGTCATGTCPATYSTLAPALARSEDDKLTLSCWPGQLQTRVHREALDQRDPGPARCSFSTRRPDMWQLPAAAVEAAQLVCPANLSSLP